MIEGTTESQRLKNHSQAQSQNHQENDPDVDTIIKFRRKCLRPV